MTALASVDIMEETVAHFVQSAALDGRGLLMSQIKKDASEPTIARVFAVLGRMLGFGIVGGFCGLLLGLANGIVNAPPDVPGEPLANEWYVVGVFVDMFIECVVASLFGASIAVAVPTPSGRWKTLGLSLAGAVLGVALGWVVVVQFHVILIHWADGSAQFSNMLTQLVGALLGMGIGFARNGGPGMGVMLDD
jgi:hypothetical protein